MRLAHAGAALLTAALATGRDASAGVERCDSAVRARPADRDAWRCYEVEGQPARVYPEVTRVLEAHLRARPGDPFPALALGRLEAGRGAERGATLLAAAEQGFARRGDADGQAQALSARVRAHAFRRQRPEADAALAALRTLAAHSVAAGPRLELAVVEAFVSQTAADYGRAITLLRGVEEDVHAHGHSVLRRGWLSTYGYVCWATGRRDEALAAYRSLAAMLKGESDGYRLASVLTDEVSIMSSAGASTPEERRRVARVALDVARASGNLSAEAAALDYLADFDGPGPASAAAVAQALEKARASGDPRSVAMALRAQCLYGEPAAADAAWSEALHAAEAPGNLDERARVLVVRSRMLWSRGPREAARAASEEAMAAAEATRTAPPDGETRARRFGQWARPYMELAGHLLSGDLLPPGATAAEGDRAGAFAALERMRGRVLLDEMDAAGVRVPAESISGGPASLREVQAALAPDEALLVYLLGDAPPSDGPTWGASSWVLAITRDRAVARPVPDNLTLGVRVSLFTGLVDSRLNEDAAGAARLHAEVIAPALEVLPASVRKLVVVPDRTLFSLPFAALRPAPSAPALGERFDISVVPSATVWLRQRTRDGPPAPQGVLAVAAPGGEPEDATGAAERGRPDTSLPGLALAREEASRAVARIGSSSRLLAGPDASESALVSAVPSGYRVLHFAAHALLDDARPQRSAIVLTPEPDRRNDGFLHLREIAALRIPGGVAVVSGCRSAGGLVLGGEGPVGLARAFFQAGARAVVGSLRPLRDDEAAAFFDRFYAHLSRGASVAGAVRLAQVDRRKAGAPTAAWAGIATLGDGGFVPFPGGGWRWPWLTVAVFVAAAATWLLKGRLSR